MHSRRNGTSERRLKLRVRPDPRSLALDGKADQVVERARGDVLEGDGERVGLGLRGVYEGIRWIIFPDR